MIYLLYILKAIKRFFNKPLYFKRGLFFAKFLFFMCNFYTVSMIDRKFTRLFSIINIQYIYNTKQYIYNIFNKFLNYAYFHGSKNFLEKCYMSIHILWRHKKYIEMIN